MQEEALSGEQVDTLLLLVGRIGHISRLSRWEVWQMGDTLAGSLWANSNSVFIAGRKRVFLNSRWSEVDPKRNDDVEIHFLKMEIGDLVPTVW